MPELKRQKLLRFEVDQSVRIEELTKDTIIGLANTEQAFTIRLRAKVKRQLYEYYRRQGKPKKFGPAVFASGIILALQQWPVRVMELIIDVEYPGHEETIRKLALNSRPEIQVEFATIGKHSPAHYAAYGVHIKKKSADGEAGKTELSRLMKK